MTVLDLHEASLAIAAEAESPAVDATARSQSRLQKVLEATG